MEQNRALNALEPFLALSKSATSPRAAADLISQATAAPQTFVFAELLQTPNIQALAQSEEYCGHLKLLEIFAWGTWNDYLNAQSQLPPINDAQSHKLRLLTLLTILTTSTTPTSTSLSYTYLQSSLSLPSPRDLENLIISGIYSSLLTASLSPNTRTVDVSSVAALRDLAPGSLTTSLSPSLSAWSRRCEAELQNLEAQILAIKVKAKKEGLRRKLQEEGFEKGLAALEKERKDGVRGFGTTTGMGSGGGQPFAVKRTAEDEEDGWGEAMDVDGEGGGWGKRGKGAGGTFGGFGRRLG
ncbi:MAG: hypothetical protein M1820_010261 [Bogoriella megaspora]|nr:MAG: hypothetical protein M1820_010261 [Bogoriella megaspora]